MEDLNIPIYRAKKIDSDEDVESRTLLRDLEDYYLVKYMDVTRGLDFHINNDDGARFEIDISTLEISFNDGESWDKPIRVKRCLRDWEQANQIINTEWDKRVNPKEDKGESRC